jgi:hypothetical protein
MWLRPGVAPLLSPRGARAARRDRTARVGPWEGGARPHEPLVAWRRRDAGRRRTAGRRAQAAKQTRPRHPLVVRRRATSQTCGDASGWPTRVRCTSAGEAELSAASRAEGLMLLMNDERSSVKSQDDLVAGLMAMRSNQLSITHPSPCSGHGHCTWPRPSVIS